MKDLVIVAAIFVLLLCPHESTPYCLRQPRQKKLDQRKGKAIRLDECNWSSGLAINYVAKILIEEMLEYPVELTPNDDKVSPDSVYNWQGMIEGRVDAALDVWAYTDDRRKILSKNTQAIESVGPSGVTARTGLFLNEWFVNEHPEAASFRGFKNPNVTKLMALNDTAISMISPPNPKETTINSSWVSTGEKGLVISMLPSYGGNFLPSLIQKHNWSMQVQYSGGEEYSYKMFGEYAKLDLPVLMGFWEPSQIFVKWMYENNTRMKLQRIALPDISEECPPSGDQQFCDFDLVTVEKVVSTSLKDRNEEAYWFLRSLSVSNAELNKIMAIQSYENKTYEDAACDWIKEKKELWQKFIWFRDCSAYQNCSGHGECIFNKCECDEGYTGSTCKPPAFVQEMSSESTATRVLVISLYLVVFVTAAMLYVYRNAKPVKALGVQFCFLMLAGIVITISATWTMVGIPTVSSCILQVWILPIGFGLCWGSLIAKTYRIYHIFNNVRRLQSASFGGAILGMIFVIVFIEILLSAIWTIADAPKPTVLESENAQSSWACSSSIGNQMMVAFYIYNGLLLLASVFFSTQIRKIAFQQYNESITIGSTVYIITIASVVILPILYLPSLNVATKYMLASLLIVLSGYAVVIALFWSRLWFVWRIPVTSGTVSDLHLSGSKLSQGATDLASKKSSKVSISTVSESKVYRYTVLAQEQSILSRWEEVDMTVVPKLKWGFFSSKDSKSAFHFKLNEIQVKQTESVSSMEGHSCKQLTVFFKNGKRVHFQAMSEDQDINQIFSSQES